MRRLLPLLALVLLVCCSFTNDLTPLKNGQCSSDRKACGDSDGVQHCVDKADPTTGCGGPSCLPCSVQLVNTNTTSCSPTHECAVSSCTDGYQDCNSINNLPSKGCEFHTDADPLNCGDCNRACPAVNNGMRGCVKGVCTPVCNRGFKHCSQLLSDGCETNTDTDPMHCGDCDKVCLTNQHCVAGMCM